MNPSPTGNGDLTGANGVDLDAAEDAIGRVGPTLDALAAVRAGGDARASAEAAQVARDIASACREAYRASDGARRLA